MDRRYRSEIALLAVAALVGLGCGVESAAPQPLVVLANDSFRFEPDTLTVQSNRPVRIALKNTGALGHDLTIVGMPSTEIRSSQAHPGTPQNAVSAHVGPKQEGSLIFTPTAQGTYEFYCAEPGHKEAGMKGTLQVS
ncbi:MAG: cupredoxin domain-containing protein [Chloroflexi bacterium]|nr:cupredoxin domain-containing protein [Chloroflexota bacterium]